MNQNCRNLAEATRRYHELVGYDLTRYNGIFAYSGGVPYLKWEIIEKWLQQNGAIAVAPKNGKLYALKGNLGDIRDEWYIPTRWVGSNPFVGDGWTYSLKRDEECVVFWNDITRQGLLPIYEYSAMMRAENELSIYMAMVNSRAQYLITCGTDADKHAADLWLNDLQTGKMSAMMGKSLVNAISATPLATQTHTLTDLIELEQYTKASTYNDLGLNANYNMKREALSQTENQMNNDALLSLLDGMMACRQRAVDKLNELVPTWGIEDWTPLEVHYSDLWQAVEDRVKTDPEELTEQEVDPDAIDGNDPELV